MTVLRLISARCTSLSRGTKWIICVPSRRANSSIISRSLSTLRLLQIRPPEADAAGLGELHDALADVVGRVHRHHLAGADDVDLLGLALADRHGESAADDVAQHVVEDVVEVLVLVVGAELLEQVDRGDDAAAGAADARLGAARLGAHRRCRSRGERTSSSSTSSPSSRSVSSTVFWASPPSKQPRGVGLGVAADHHDLAAHLRQRRDRVLGRRRLADAALAVNRHLTHRLLLSRSWPVNHPSDPGGQSVPSRLASSGSQ